MMKTKSLKCLYQKEVGNWKEKWKYVIAKQITNRIHHDIKPVDELEEFIDFYCNFKYP